MLSALLLLVPTSPSRAATQIDVFAAGADALAVHVEVNLPEAIPSSIPVVGGIQSATIDVSAAEGEAAGALAAAPTATASGTALTSNVAVLDTLGGEPAEAALDGEGDAEGAIAAQDVGLVKVGLGAREAHVKPAPSADSAASLASLFIGLDEESALVEFAAADASQTSARNGDAVTAESSAAVADLAVLGDLITVGSVKTTTSATTSGAAGAAKATIVTEIVDLKVADVLEISIGPDGVSGTVLGNELPDTGETVDTVIEGINGVLALAGVVIVVGDTTENAAADGSAAEAAFDGIGIVVNPLQAEEPLVSLRLGAAGATVAATRADIPEDPPTPEDPPEGELPETGGSRTPETTAAVLALTAAAAAATLRRRANRTTPLT